MTMTVVHVVVVVSTSTASTLVSSRSRWWPIDIRWSSPWRWRNGHVVISISVVVVWIIIGRLVDIAVVVIVSHGIV